MDRGLRCAVHPDEPVAAMCTGCGRAMCDACWRFAIKGRPACDACADGSSSEPYSAPLATVFLCMVWGTLGYFTWLRIAAGKHPFLEIGVPLAVVSGVAAVRMRRPRAPRHTRQRAAEDLPAHAPAAGFPYRAMLRRAARRAVPPLSAKTTALVVGLCLVVAGALFPPLLHLPRWVENEIVIASWWAVWATALSTILYKGWRLSDDYRFVRPALSIALGGARKPAAEPPARRRASAWSDAAGCLDPSGCFFAGDAWPVFLALLVAALALVAAWLMLELVLPLLVFAAYLLISRALIRVANDRHECAGDLPRALLWGAAWSAVYVAPLAAIVYAVHAVLHHARG